jgi:hypothetical protein
MIFKYTNYFRSHINLSLVNKQFYFISYHWIYSIPRTICKELIDENVFNKIIKKYKIIHTLNLSQTKVEDKNLKLFNNDLITD